PPPRRRRRPRRRRPPRPLRPDAARYARCLDEGRSPGAALRGFGHRIPRGREVGGRPAGWWRGRASAGAGWPAQGCGDCSAWRVAQRGAAQRGGSSAQWRSAGRRGRLRGAGWGWGRAEGSRDPSKNPRKRWSRGGSPQVRAGSEALFADEIGGELGADVVAALQVGDEALLDHGAHPEHLHADGGGEDALELVVPEGLGEELAVHLHLVLQAVGDDADAVVAALLVEAPLLLVAEAFAHDLLDGRGQVAQGGLDLHDPQDVISAVLARELLPVREAQGLEKHAPVVLLIEEYLVPEGVLAAGEGVFHADVLGHGRILSSFAGVPSRRSSRSGVGGEVRV